MKRQITPVLVFFLFFVLNSCEDRNHSIFYQLVPSTFEDALILDGTVEAVKSATITCPRGVSGTVVYIVEDGVNVKKGDTICILENKELLNDYEDLLANVEKSKAQYEKNKANLKMNYSLLKAQVQNNEAQTLITNLDSVQLVYLSPQQRQIKKLELKKAAIEKAKFEQKLYFLEQINDSELKKSKLQIERRQNRADRIERRLNNLILISSQDGLVVRGISWATGNKVQEGDQVWSGMPVANIPDLSEMKVTIYAPESAYKRLSEKDEIVYTFDAMPGNMAWGKIIKKAPMGKPISRNSKVKYFEVNASVDSFKVIPDVGISANSRIIIAQVADTVVVPQLAIFNEDSINVVYIKSGRNFGRREILLGKSSPKEAVVTAGLIGNEVITFEKPSTRKVKSNILLPDSLKYKQEPEKLIENKLEKPSMPISIKMQN